MALYYCGIDNIIGRLEVFGKGLISYTRKRRPDIHIVILTAYSHIAFEDYFIQLGYEVMHIPPKGKSLLEHYGALLNILPHHKQQGIIFK